MRKAQGKLVDLARAALELRSVERSTKPPDGGLSKDLGWVLALNALRNAIEDYDKAQRDAHAIHTAAIGEG